MSYGNPSDASVGFYSGHQDLHFVNNTVMSDPSNTFPGWFVAIGCFNEATGSCPAPAGGSDISTNAVIENNIFLGPSGFAAGNQSTAYGLSDNVVETNNSGNVSAMGFNDVAALDFRLVSNSSPAYAAGIWPPTNNGGSTDTAAEATEEYSFPLGAFPAQRQVARRWMTVPITTRQSHRRRVSASPIRRPLHRRTAAPLLYRACRHRERANTTM